MIPQVDAVIHHGGNNSFTECLYFGKPAIIMPYVWDGHDNATRVEETGHGFKLDRYDWTEEELARKIKTMLTDKKMKAKLKKTSKHMRSQQGPDQGRQDHRRACCARSRMKAACIGAPLSRSGELCRSAQGLGASADPIAGNSKTMASCFTRAQRAAEVGCGNARPAPGRRSRATSFAISCRAARPTRIIGRDIEVVPGTVVLFPAGWTGTCAVH